MAAQVGSFRGDDHDMEGAGFDSGIAAGTHVSFPCRVGLHRYHCFVHPAIAQMMTAAVTENAITTIAISSTEVRCSRNGLNPIRSHMVSTSAPPTGLP